jgi:hypothetical protein
LERPAPVAAWSGCISQLNLGIKAPSEHPIVRTYEISADTRIVKAEARQGGDIGIGYGIQTRGKEVDDFY